VRATARSTPTPRPPPGRGRSGPGAATCTPTTDPAVIAVRALSGWRSPGMPRGATRRRLCRGGGLAAGLSVSLGPDRRWWPWNPSSATACTRHSRRAGQSTLRWTRPRRRRLAPHVSACTPSRAAVVRESHARAGHGAGNRPCQGLAVGRTPAGRRAGRRRAFAAWLEGRVPGRHPCLVLCGANTGWHPE